MEEVTKLAEQLLTAYNDHYHKGQGTVGIREVFANILKQAKIVESDTWILVTEELPKKREYIVVVNMNNKLKGCCKSKPEVWYWTNTNREAERLKTFFTHWRSMVLPHC